MFKLRTDIIEFSPVLVMIIFVILIYFVPEFKDIIGIGGLFAILLFVIFVGTYFFWKIVIQKVKPIVMRNKKRVGKPIRRIGRMFEFFFFLFIFIATTMITFALPHRDAIKSSDAFLYILYLAGSFIFYYSALFCGIAYYRYKIYD